MSDTAISDFVYKESERLEPKYAKQPIKFVCVDEMFFVIFLKLDRFCINLLAIRFISVKKMARIAIEIAWHKTKTP